MCWSSTAAGISSDCTALYTHTQHRCTHGCVPLLLLCQVQPCRHHTPPHLDVVAHDTAAACQAVSQVLCDCIAGRVTNIQLLTRAQYIKEAVCVCSGLGNTAARHTRQQRTGHQRSARNFAVDPAAACFMPPPPPEGSCCCCCSIVGAPATLPQQQYVGWLALTRDLCCLGAAAGTAA